MILSRGRWHDGRHRKGGARAGPRTADQPKHLPERALPIPKAAYDVQKLPADSRRLDELSFKIDLSYPSKEVLEFYEEYLAAQGWTKCKGGVDEWDSFVDMSAGHSQLIHQLFRVWVKRDQNVEAVVSLRYYSEGVDERRKTPTNKIQFVNVLIIDDLADLDRQLKLYGLECPPASQRQTGNASKAQGSKIVGAAVDE